ncbi:DNA repair protein [Deinococcus sp. KSM4-11]|uniref:DNA repair protein n=1 Tax=Deinococcus sp. KSM4-11 TaxID=2568654 RepID=UPI0010A2BC38|nr:DNA repair protein [Deinococcus sp. KSM4-11]THF86704.1 DNA repair protein [Deinococcus sp. KSM4-11]
MARVKTKETTPTPSSPYAHLDAFDALMATAAVDSRVTALAESGADTQTLNEALTESLVQAQRRWGLGLHHLRHAAELVEDGGAADIALLTDGARTALVSAGSAAIAAAYAPMQALDERGLSLWGALSDGHRVPADAPFATLKALIEDARDFETHWMPGRGGALSRVWRSGEHLRVEVSRPASPQEALSDAAWDVITGIKDRTFQRELMSRSEEMGLLGALLAARHAGAGANLNRLPEAHFTVQAVVATLEGSEGRSAEGYRTALRAATAELEEHQAGKTRQLAQVLKHGLQGS